MDYIGIDWDNITVDKAELILNELEKEEDLAKFDYYYDKLREALLFGKDSHLASAKKLLNYAINVYSTRHTPSKELPSDALLKSMVYYIDSILYGKAESLTLLNKFEVSTIQNMKKIAVRFYKEFSNENIAAFVLERSKASILKGLREGLTTDYLTDLIIEGKANIVALQADGVLTEQGTKDLLDTFQSYIDIIK